MLPKNLCCVALVATVIIASSVLALAGNTSSSIVEFSVQEISELSVTGPLSGPIHLTAPESAASTPFGDANTFLHYTSIVRSSETRTITASITSGTLPSGCALEIEVGDIQGSGQAGTASPSSVLASTAPEAVIEEIRNCASDSGATGGVRIGFRLIVVDEALLIPGETTSVTVTFTLN